jgi:hypothetical protein
MTPASNVQQDAAPALSLVGGLAAPPPIAPPGLALAQDHIDGQIIIKFKSDLGPGLQGFIASTLQSAMQATLASSTQTLWVANCGSSRACR